MFDVSGTNALVEPELAPVVVFHAAQENEKMAVLFGTPRPRWSIR